jgi:hypothetical protein
MNKPILMPSPALSTRRGDTGHRLLQRRACGGQTLRVGQFRTAVAIRRLRRVFQKQFYDASDVLAGPVPGHCDTEVDARCDAASGEPIAVDADAFVAELSAPN